MKLVNHSISLTELKEMSNKMFGSLVKAVVDVEKEIVAVDADMHADLEYFLLENNSNQINLWGINLYPDKAPDINWIEFDSMINIRPSWGNRTRSVDDPKIQEKIRAIIKKLVIA